MALSAGLEKAGHPAERIETRAAVTIETVDGAPKVTRSALDVRGKGRRHRRGCLPASRGGGKEKLPLVEGDPGERRDYDGAKLA